MKIEAKNKLQEVQQSEFQESNSEEILLLMIKKAIFFNASDIHIDPGKNNAAVKYRINGRLQSQKPIQFEKYQEILSRIKIHCHLRIDDHVSPKDGSFSLNINGHEASLRVSILSTRCGENIVMRILNRTPPKTLYEIGITEEDQGLILFSLSKQGTIGIVMGPTGSGKTTTLYALLNELKKEDLMAVTIEDPIEYRLEGLRQIEIKEGQAMTFSNALRSTLRQDPDIILVGEIRDYETAILAFQAALTGHIVITSIHAYETTHLVPRLLLLGVPQYLIDGLRMLIINQRLIKKEGRERLALQYEVKYP